MLSSMSDPSDLAEDTFAALSNLPSKAGAAAIDQIKDAANVELASSKKELDIEYKVSAPTSDVKTGLLHACKAEGASWLFIGPGAGANGTMPPFVASTAKGINVAVVRDEAE